tara:strand:- start:477 stop:1385 length:909 start_codon:yes stop_codon:yes gene_type:complete
MAGLMEKLKKNSHLKDIAILDDSIYFAEKDMIQTNVPMVNAALSGKLDGGLTPGLTVLAGPSKHFKTSFALLMAAAYQEKYKDAVILFYDSEFGSPRSYFEAYGIDTSRVLHVPIMDIEELKFDIMSQLVSLDRKDKVIIVIDSIGNLASKKEVEDAKDQKSVADMTRAKSLKGLFRMVTPYLTKFDIPMLAVNHTYMTQEMFSKAVVSGGCVVEGTMIQTPDGLKAIESFSVGDTVMTSYGTAEVSNAWNPDTLEEGNPECYEVSFEDGYSVTCSADHKFLIDGDWVKAKDLVDGMDCQVL